MTSTEAVHPTAHDRARAGREITDQTDADPLSATGIVALGLTAIAFVVFRLSDMTLGLQTDELLSAWVTSDGISDAVARAQRFQGNSAVYFVFLWFWRQLAGDSEVMLRLPSLLAFVWAGREMVRFGKHLGSADLGAIATGILVGGASVTQAMTTARPYGFLLLFAVLSTRRLWCYCGSGRRRDGAIWAITLALAIAMTPFAATLAAVQGALIFVWRDRRPSLRSILGFGAFSALLVAPLVPQILALSDRRASLVIIAPPHPLAILVVALPWLSLLAVGALAVAGVEKDRLRSHLCDSRIILFAAWAFVPPILLFVSGLAGDSPVFSDRYRSVSLFGGAFLVAALAVSLRGRGPMVAAVAIAVVTGLAIQRAEPQSHGWRDAVATANATTTEADDRVVALNPGLVESEDHTTLYSQEWADYLGAPIDHYSLAAPVVVLSQNAPTESLVEDRLERLLGHEVIIVIDGPPGHRWREIVTAEALGAGYVLQTDSRHDALTTTVLRRN